MALATWQATIQDDTGNAVSSPVITVRVGGSGGALADIYDTTGSLIVNPTSGNADGFVQFQADQGLYWIQAASGGNFTEGWLWDAVPFDVDPLTDAEVEAAYNNQVGQITPAERTSGAETAVRRFSPEDVATMAGIHGGGGVETRFSSRSEAVSSTVDASVDAIDVVYDDGTILTFSRDPSGDALTTNGGTVTWSPSGDIHPDHWVENVTPGTTDMTTAIASAYAFAGDGGRVVLLPNEYLTSGTSTTNAVSLHVKFGGKLKLANGAESNVLKYSNTTTPFTIFGLEIDGNKANQTVSDDTTIGLYTFECDNVSIDSCYVHDCSYDGIRVQGNGTSNVGKDIVVTNCVVNANGVDDTNRRAPGIRTFITRGCIVSNNTCNDNTTDGIDIDAFTFNGTFTSNRTERNRRNGIFIEEGSKRCTVANNIVRLTGDQALWPTQTSGTGINVNNEAVTGTGNSITDIIISGNVVHTSNQAGIRVSANQPNTYVDRIVITGNVCIDNDVLATATAGINIRANASGFVDNVMITNNVSFGNSTYGLSIGSANITDVAIGGNDLRGNGTSEMINSGSTSVRFLPEATMDSSYTGRVGRAKMTFEHTGVNDAEMKLKTDSGDCRLQFQRTSGSGYECVNEAGVWKVKRGTGGATDTDTIININGDRVLFNLPVRLPEYTVATAPAANAPGSGSEIYVSNGAAGQPIVAFSDGSNWLRCDTRAVISSS